MNVQFGRSYASLNPKVPRENELIQLRAKLTQLQVNGGCSEDSPQVQRAQARIAHLEESLGIK